MAKKKKIDGRKTGKKKKDIKNAPTRKTFLHDEPRKLTQGSKPVLRIDTIEYQQKIEKCYECIKQGMRSNEIYAEMLMQDEEMNEHSFAEIMKYAYKYAENQLHKDRDFVFQLHMNRYEKMFEQAMLLEDSWHRPLDHKQNPTHWPVICARLLNAMKVLKSKEDLIGLHDKNIVIELNDEKATIIEKEHDRGMHSAVPGCDLDKLTLEEKKELLDYLKEIRTVPIEGIQRVTIKKTVIEINTNGMSQKSIEEQHIDDVDVVKDITFEEMPEDVVSKFEDISEEEEQEDPVAPLVIDSTKGAKGKPGVEVEQKVHNNMLERFKAKMREKRN